MNGMCVSNLHIFPVGPADHDSVLMSASWTEPAPYDDGGTIFTWNVVDPVPAHATAVLVRVKLKAYVPAGTGLGYCQGNIRFVNPDKVMNHFGHVDEWGRADGNSGEGRRITYVTAFVPIKDGEIAFRVAYEIFNRGNFDFGVYLEGYVANGQLGVDWEGGCIAEEPEE